VFREGGYRFIQAVFQYSGGVAAEPGFEIVRARLAQPLALEQGFEAIQAHLQAAGRPLTAFCACELRSPAPFTEQGFLEFNKIYAKTLERWGLYKKGVNPVARTNVCPAFEPPAKPSLYAYSYTVPAKAGARGSFIVAGGGEAPEGKANYRDFIVRRGDTSPEGLREKVRTVLAEMERRLAALGFSWKDAISTQAYTVHDIGPLVEKEIVRRGAATGGLAWHYARPPIIDLDFEMDVRGAAREIVA
jgi:enamine deaminase RidA (YjgF/YER057c/UK114 family)